MFFLRQDHCDHHDFWKCEGNFVAYHPFKATRRELRAWDDGMIRSDISTESGGDWNMTGL